MKTSIHSNPLAACALVLTMLGGAGASVGQGKPTASVDGVFLDSTKPTEARLDDLLRHMTLEEKVSQMHNTAPAIPRLGIPAYNWWSEGLHGIARSGYATVFPQAIGLAATWDTGLMHQVAETIAIETRAKNTEALRHDIHSIYYGLDLWSPNINIFRDPRWGRGQETYGEDPYLTARLGVAFVKGLQGDNPHYCRTIATPKHYAVHSGPESTRHKANIDVSPHDLWDTYLPAFRATVTEGQAASVMCAYNAVDGVPACASPFLLNEILRKDWGFTGYVTSDCAAVSDIARGHQFAPDLEHAAVVAVRAGTDTSCGNEYTNLTAAVHDHLIAESEIDTAVRRLFAARLRMGLFDPPAKVADARIPSSQNDSAQHRALALKVAERSMVLLKNNGVLPLSSKSGTIAVIGPNAASLTAIEGNYNAVPSHPVLPLDGMMARFGKVLYAQGSPYVAELPVPVPRSILHPSTAVPASGLKGEYFANTTLAGAPAFTRIDPQISFDWNSASPGAGLSSSAFSVRWTGTISGPVAGPMSFHFTLAHCSPCDGVETIQVFLDGKQVNAAAPTPYRRSNLTTPFTLTFADTTPHALRIEYTHRAPLFGAGLTLDWMPNLAAEQAEAVRVARQADTVVAFVGLSPELEGEEMSVHVAGFDGGDRTAIELPAAQQSLLEALAATGKPLVVVMLNGSALAMPWAKEHAAAILEAWYPGEEGGTAIAHILAGEANPSGRLPVTFYASTGQLPAFDDYSVANRTYRYFKGQPLWGFGYGLGYTTFRWSHLKLSTTHLRAGVPLVLDADVENTGGRSGDAVSEIYLTPPASATAPRVALVGIGHTSLRANQRGHIQVLIDPRSLSTVAGDGSRAVAAGAYSIFVGGAQPTDDPQGLSAAFSIYGTKALPR